MSKTQDEPISDDTKRWFAIGFAELWVQSGDAQKYQTERMVNAFATEVTEKTGVLITGPTMSCVLNQTETGNAYPGDKKRRALAQWYGKTADEVIALGRQIESAGEIDILTAHRNIVDQFQDRELAYQINEKLLRLEKADPTILRRIFEVIEKVEPQSEPQSEPAPHIPPTPPLPQEERKLMQDLFKDLWMESLKMQSKIDALEKELAQYRGGAASHPHNGESGGSL